MTVSGVTIAVRNWDRFQHYKDRDPPWIKLYRDMLTSEPWVMGTDLSRLVQVAITLLAARYQNAIPYQFGMIKKVASLDCTPAAFAKAIDFLAEKNFLKIQGVTIASNGLAQDASNVLASCYTRDRAEQSRAETEQSRAETETLSDSKQSDLRLVFDHWRQTHHHPRAQLDPKRSRSIAAALKTYSVADLCQCITGYLNSPHHMGQNDRDTKFDDIELFLRDSKHVDAGLKFFADPPRTGLSEKSRRIIDQTQDWQPPEVRRNASH